MSRPARIPNCHPDRQHYAKGLCSSCYIKQRDRSGYKEWRKRDYKKNPEKYKKRVRKGREKYGEKIKEANERWHRSHPENMLVSSAKHRAKLKGLEFNLSPSDVSIPELCPVLDIPLIPFSGKFSPNSPSLDRIDNTRGYVKGNVIVVSFRANSLKKDATPEELRKVADFYTRLKEENNA